MNKVIVLSLIIFSLFLTPFSCAKTQKEEYQNDYLYSEEYFDYLIECASYNYQEKMEEEKKKKKAEMDEITVSSDAGKEEFISETYEPFKLRIENSKISPYGETFKKVDSKTIIPVGDNLSFIQNLTKTRNKYSSNDYKILAGAEYNIGNYFRLGGGLETNFRGIDQNPTSRKLYVVPQFFITDKISLSFYNKVNVQNYSTDHDIGLTFSPFKSKFMDFGVYAGITRTQTGKQSESINFSTNLYLF